MAALILNLYKNYATALFLMNVNCFATCNI